MSFGIIFLNWEILDLFFQKQKINSISKTSFLTNSCLEEVKTLKKISDAVIKETSYVAAWVVVLSAFMQSVVLILQAFGFAKWDYTIALGNLLGGVFAILNFFLMGITVQIAVEKDEKKAAQVIRLSQMLRNLAVGVIIIIGVFVPVFNVWTVALPFFFPRIAVAFRSLFLKKQQ